MLSSTLAKRTLNTMATTAVHQNVVLAAAVDASATHVQHALDFANVNAREAAKVRALVVRVARG